MIMSMLSLQTQLCPPCSPARPAAAGSRCIRHALSRVVLSRALTDHNGGDNPNERDPGQQRQQQRQAPQQEQLQEQHHQQRPFIWCQGILGGAFVNEVDAVFLPVDWQPSNLLRVLYFGLPAAAAAVLANSCLAALLNGSSSSSTLLDPGTADSAAAAAAGLGAAELAAATTAGAVLHVSQEAVLAALMPAAVWLALGPRVASARWDGYWVVQTLATCAVLFPLVDPLLWGAWQPAVQAVLGPAPSSPLVATLHQAADAGDWGSVGMHCIASGVLGPLWEEVFWRGFFLTALTKVLPLPMCVAFSSVNFAVLHLSPHNLLPLLVLSSCGDCLYLRSGGNLLAPLLLHGLWNTSQVLQIALLHKDTFV